MKSVLYYSNHLRGPKGAAGARSWHQVRCLSEQYHVTVVIPAVDPVTSHPVYTEDYDGLDLRSVDVRMVSVVRNDRTNIRRRALYYLSAVATQLRIGLTIPRPHVVFSMSLPLTQLAVAAVVSAVRRVPLVVDVRDLPFETAAEVGYLRRRWLVRSLIRLETYFLSRANAILTNSPHYQRHLIRRGISGDGIHVALIGYDDFGAVPQDHIASWRTRLNESFGESPPEFIAIYAGTIGHAFPVETLLDAAQEVSPGASIGFAFLGDGQRLQEYQSRATRQNLPVRFLGRVSKSDVHAACRAADACLYPAGTGPFSAAILGNKVFDYLGAERPIVYVGGPSAVSEVIEFLGAGILCAPDAPADVACSIERMAQDDAWRESLIQGAKGFRKAGYTARASAEVLRNLVERVSR